MRNVSVAMMAVLAISGMAMGATYDFAAAFNGTLTATTPDGLAGTATGSGASLVSPGQFSSGSLSAASNAVSYDVSSLDIGGYTSGAVGFWYKPGYTPSADSGANTLFKMVAANNGGDGWVPSIEVARSGSNLGFAIVWGDWSYNGVTAGNALADWVADEWHYISAQWANVGGSENLAIYVDGNRMGYTSIGYVERLRVEMATLYVGGNVDSGSYANGLIDGFTYSYSADPTSATMAVPTTDVPEPMTLALLAAGAVGGLRRRK